MDSYHHTFHFLLPVLMVLLLASCHSHSEKSSSKGLDVNDEHRIFSLVQGRNLYRRSGCASCHGVRGVSTTPVFKSLTYSKTSQSLSSFTDSLFGINTENSKVNQLMFVLASKLTINETAQILTYIDSFEGNQKRHITVLDIAPWIKKSKEKAKIIYTEYARERKRILSKLPTGEAVYQGACIACHHAGIAGAPTLNNKEEWLKRIKLGRDNLYLNAINGIGVMPAKGGQKSLTELQVKQAVDYILRENGL